MFLSKAEIIKEARRGHEGDPTTLVIRPFEEEQVTAVHVGHPMPSYGPASDGYDVRYGAKAKRRRRTGKPFAPALLTPADYEDVLPEECPETGRSCFVIPPMSGLCIMALEWVQMPPNLTAIVACKSTYARSFNFLPPTKVNPGWHGHLVLEVVNLEPDPARHYIGDGAATFVFGRVGGDLEAQAYYQGAYQGQAFEDLAPRSLLAGLPSIGQGGENEYNEHERNEPE